MKTLIDAIAPILKNLQDLTEQQKQQDLTEQQKQIEQQVETEYCKLISLFFEKLPQIYQTWRPQIGEQVVELNFCVSPPVARLLYVRLVDDYSVRMAKTMEEDSLFMVVDLDEGVEEYEEPIFVVPLPVYSQYFKALGFREYLDL